MRCEGCGKRMNPAQAMMGPVCGECARRNQKAVLEGKDRYDGFGDWKEVEGAEEDE